jgi:hypothetical protein
MPLLSLQQRHSSRRFRDRQLPSRRRRMAALRSVRLVQCFSSPASGTCPLHPSKLSIPPPYHHLPVLARNVVQAASSPWPLLAAGINSLWRDLCRTAAPSINYSRSSLIPLPHPVIVPGGRFREIYYWDSYFIVLGLLGSGMPQTAGERPAAPSQDARCTPSRCTSSRCGRQRG